MNMYFTVRTMVDRIMHLQYLSRKCNSYKIITEFAPASTFVSAAKRETVTYSRVASASFMLLCVPIARCCGFPEVRPCVCMYTRTCEELCSPRADEINEGRGCQGVVSLWKNSVWAFLRVQISVSGHYSFAYRPKPGLNDSCTSSSA